MTHNPIIVALDVESAEEARTLVERIGPAAGFYKVGMELYAAAGAQFAFDNLSDEFTAQDAHDLATLERDYARVVFDNSAYRVLELR